jgi:hypothetical protein
MSIDRLAFQKPSCGRGHGGVTLHCGGSGGFHASVLRTCYVFRSQQGPLAGEGVKVDVKMFEGLT